MNIRQISVTRPDAELHVRIYGESSHRPPVFFSHSILSSSVMWAAQTDLLVQEGWQVICADTRGHGGSKAHSTNATMETLVADTVAIVDALQLDKIHYVGLSLGGMSGFGLALRHAERLSSICICDARADAPSDVAAPWDERITIAERDGCQALAQSTLQRWFGKAFLDDNPDIQTILNNVAAATSTNGFIACACAIQGLNYLPMLGGIRTPTTLLVGSKDGVLPQALQQIASLIEGSHYEVIAEAGHLPNIDQPDAFNAALLRHLSRSG